MKTKRWCEAASTLAAAVLTSTLAMPAWAQGNLSERMVNGANTATASGTPRQSGQPLPPWPTKAALLEAARNGTFKGLPEIRVDADLETAPLTNSVIRILRFEYMVPPLGGNDSIRTCRGSASGEIRRLLTGITNLHVGSLSERPPSFYRETNTTAIQENIQSEMGQLGKGWCSTTLLGVEHPHPYGAALSKLAQEFSAATKEYVEAERGRRIAAYGQDQARAQADQQAKANAQAQRDADIRAADQKRIASERARIEAEQTTRQQQEKNRIASERARIEAEQMKRQQQEKNRVAG